MYHKIWIAGNVALLALSFVYIWLFRPHDSSLVVSSQLLAQIAVVLFLVNINMYFIFLVIRNTSVRKVKVKLAKFSRMLMKWHITIAVTATTVIIGHGAINFFTIGPLIGYGNGKLISGYAAILLLSVTLFAGYLRHKKSSGFRRKFHLISSMTFFLFFLVHMFMPA